MFKTNQKKSKTHACLKLMFAKSSKECVMQMRAADSLEKTYKQPYRRVCKPNNLQTTILNSGPTSETGESTGVKAKYAVSKPTTARTIELV